MTDLFHIPETLSPRLAWMKRNNISAEIVKGLGLWLAAHEAGLNSRYTTGKTEDEAITSLAKLLNIPLWNEEGFKI